MLAKKEQKDMRKKSLKQVESAGTKWGCKLM